MKAKTKKVPRLVFEIRFENGEWSLFAPGHELVFDGGGKSTMIRIAADRLLDAWIGLHVRSELIIKTKTGKIQDKRTYGEDPRKSKG